MVTLRTSIRVLTGKEQQVLVRGMVMSECHKSPTFDAQSSADALFHFLRKNLGTSKFDIFRHFSRHKGARPCFPNEPRSCKFRKLPTEEMKATCQKYMKNFAKLNKTRSPRVEVRNIAGTTYYLAKVDVLYRVPITVFHPHDLFLDIASEGIYWEGSATASVTLDLSSDLGLDEVNSLAVLMGTHPENLKLRELITPDFALSCRTGVTIEHVRTETTARERKFSDTMLAGVVLDLFMYLADIRKPSDATHLAQEAVDDVVEGIHQMALVKMAEDSKYGLIQQICPHCGMKVHTFDVQFILFKCVVGHLNFSLRNDIFCRKMRCLHSGELTSTTAKLTRVCAIAR